MDIVKMREALAEAQQGLKDIDVRFEGLKVQKLRLEAVIASLEAMFGLDYWQEIIQEPLKLSLMPNEGEPKANPTTPLWILARDVLAERMHPMTVPQIVDVLVERGIAPVGDGIRVAMFRKTDIFKKAGYGLYALTEWPDYIANVRDSLEAIKVRKAEEATEVAS